MRHFQTIRAAALLTVGMAALSLGACNKNSPSQNGAYVAGPTDSSLPVSGQPLPPSNEYQQVANTPPPPLPVYDQPPIPAYGYVWTPGYWDWSDDDDDYYWVPGTWVEPPEPGVYWTPGYWRYYDGRYLYSDGYWGPDVGYYGGVDYGYGYGGEGYAGGRWQGDRFYYNNQVNNFGGRRIPTVYSQGVATNDSRVSFNGGPGGLRVAPAQAEIAAAQARHMAPTRVQVDAMRMARAEPQLRASVNGGAPPIAATSRPAAFRAGAGVTAARSASNYVPPAGLAPLGGQGLQGGAARPLAGRLGAPQGPGQGPAEIGRAARAGRPAQAFAPDQTPAPGEPLHAAAPVREPHMRAQQPFQAQGPVAVDRAMRGPAMHAAPQPIAPMRVAPQARAFAPARAAPAERAFAPMRAAPQPPAMRAAPQAHFAPAPPPMAAARPVAPAHVAGPAAPAAAAAASGGPGDHRH
jgi:hypothetical protein